MSMMLTFADTLWVSARKYAQNGQRSQAFAALKPLLQNEQTRSDLRILAYRLAARLEMQVARCQKARQHLRAAIQINDNCSEVYYELGMAWHSDPMGCDERAARCFVRALKRNPTKPLYRAALGRALVGMGEIGRGVKQLLRAARELPHNLEITVLAVEGLIQARRFKQAGQIIQQATFRNRTDSRLCQLREQIRFAKASTHSEPVYTECDSAILCFPEAVGSTPGLRLRIDSGSRPQPHVMRLRAYRV